MAPRSPLRPRRRCSPALAGASALIFFVNGAAFASWVSRIPALARRHGPERRCAGQRAVRDVVRRAAVVSARGQGRAAARRAPARAAGRRRAAADAADAVPDRHPAVAGAGDAGSRRGAGHDAGRDERAGRRRAGARAAADHVVAARRLERGRAGRRRRRQPGRARGPAAVAAPGRRSPWRSRACCCWPGCCSLRARLPARSADGADAAVDELQAARAARRSRAAGAGRDLLLRVPHRGRAGRLERRLAA